MGESSNAHRTLFIMVRAGGPSSEEMISERYRAGTSTQEGSMTV